MRLRSLLLPLVLMAMPVSALAQPAASPTWQFVVAGDSRNCGDVIMPAIAHGAQADSAQFYWHLGDFRAIYEYDEDMVQAAAMAGNRLNISDYLHHAFQDAIDNQLKPFDPVPVYVAIGNHETYWPMKRSEWAKTFAAYLDRPEVRQQRLKDDPADATAKTYYHWTIKGIDFITLDNGSCDMFDEAQMTWLEALLARDKADPAIKTVVVGMHAALPDSRACGHSMSDYPREKESGHKVYQDLLKLRDDGHKQVYVLASHSHFILDDVYDSDFWQNNGGVLPGWIVGTAGAVRYRLPRTIKEGPNSRTDVYGYLLATVAPPGSAPGTITFEFKEVGMKDIPEAIVKKYGKSFVDDFCFAANREMSPTNGACGTPRTCKP
jgi:hypothetical protein